VQTGPLTKNGQSFGYIHKQPQWLQWVDSGTSSSHHATDRLTPHSCNSKDAKFNGMTCWSRPKAALREFIELVDEGEATIYLQYTLRFCFGFKSGKALAWFA
jgi:hypothetical protein